MWVRVPPVPLRFPYHRCVRTPRLLQAAWRLVDRFEARGVYVPGDDSKPISPWRDFGWPIAGWLLAIALFVLIFAIAL